MPSDFVICPVCRTVFVLQYSEGDLCPACEQFELELFDLFLEEVASTFEKESDWE